MAKGRLDLSLRQDKGTIDTVTTVPKVVLWEGAYLSEFEGPEHLKSK